MFTYLYNQELFNNNVTSIKTGSNAGSPWLTMLIGPEITAVSHATC